MILMITLLPGLPEIAENLEHLLHDGHLRHSEQHEQNKGTENHAHGLDDEHGCTPMSHHCGCHASAVAVLTHGAPALDPCPSIVGHMPTGPARPLGPETRPLSRANAPPTPPPIA